MEQKIENEIQSESESDEDSDQDSESPDTHHRRIHYKPAFLHQIQQYRVDHIMRNRDAIRTYRLKQIYSMIQRQYPV